MKSQKENKTCNLQTKEKQEKKIVLVKPLKTKTGMELYGEANYQCSFH